MTAATQAYVLVVDDDSVNRLLLARSLEREGHRVATAEDGHKALENLRADSFDVVLLDVLMPKMDGFEVLAQMQADNDLRRIPVIMISALEDIESVVRGIELGADDYLPKPFNPVLLRARINAGLMKKRLNDLERGRGVVVPGCEDDRPLAARENLRMRREVAVTVEDHPSPGR